MSLGRQVGVSSRVLVTRARDRWGDRGTEMTGLPSLSPSFPSKTPPIPQRQPCSLPRPKRWSPRAFRVALASRDMSLRDFYRRARIKLSYGTMRGWTRDGSWRRGAWAPSPEMLPRIASTLGLREKDLVR